MLKIGDLVEVRTVFETTTPMTQRFGGCIGLIVADVATIHIHKNSPIQKYNYVVLLQEKQREYWFTESELKIID
jgi:hypothetical protein